MLHSIGIIAVAAIVTLFIRAIPFVLFGGKREVPATVTYLGKVLPPAIMVILVVYCDISASSILNQCERAIFRPFHTIFL